MWNDYDYFGAGIAIGLVVAFVISGILYKSSYRKFETKELVEAQARCVTNCGLKYMQYNALGNNLVKCVNGATFELNGFVELEEMNKTREANE